MLTPENIAEAIKASGIRRDTNPGTLTLKAATDTVVSPASGYVTYDQDVVIPRFRPRVRELIPEARVSTGLVGFFASSTEGTAAIVAEDGAKPQMSSLVTLKGDGNVYGTEQCGLANVRAATKALIRKGKSYSPESRAWRWYSALWPTWPFARRVLLKLYRLFRCNRGVEGTNR